MAINLLKGSSSAAAALGAGALAFSPELLETAHLETALLW